MSILAPNLLHHFLICSDVKESNSILEVLLRDYAAPVVRRIVSSKVRQPENEDVQHDVLVDLISRLQSAKRLGIKDSIGDLNAYSAVAAYHGCKQHYRRRFPERHRTRARLRYVLARHPHFAVWKTLGGEWVCGRRDSGVAAPQNPATRSSSLEMMRLIEAILEKSSSPCLLEDLVEQIGEQHTAAQVEPATIETRLTHRQWIQQLWFEIGELPLPQRISLLLSMRDDNGNSGLILFPMVGAASLRQIAARLGMPAEELARLWHCLPLNDLCIGERLSLDRQRVIDLRKSARERLSRRVKL